LRYRLPLETSSYREIRVDAYTTMSKQALDSERVRSGLKAILLGPAQLYEALRARGAGAP